MNYIYNAFSAEDTEAKEVIETIEKLTERLKSSTLLQDKRTSLLAIKGLSKDYKKFFTKKTIEATIEFFKEDHDDPSISKDAVLTLGNLVEPLNEGETEICNNFCLFLSKDPTLLSEIFKTLTLDDFYSRYDTLRLLTVLNETSPLEVQTTIINTSSLPILMDVLDDSREIIRNEGLLLLISLTQLNTEIQKIAVFGNIFEKIFEIFKAEESLISDVVVYDCLQLAINLLKHNNSNQSYFKEISGFQNIYKLLFNTSQIIKQNGYEIWSNDQNITNLSKYLSLVRKLILPKEFHTLDHQNIFRESGTIETMIQIINVEGLPATLLSHFVFALGDLIIYNEKNKQTVDRLLSSHGSSLMDIIKSSILNKLCFTLQVAGIYLFQCYIAGEADIQLGMSSTLNVMSNTKDQELTLGSLILKPFDMDIEKIISYSNDEISRDIWISSVMLCHILHKNKKCKQRCLKITTKVGDKDVSLFQKCLNIIIYCLDIQSEAKNRSRICVSLLCLLSFWAHNCQEAVDIFLKEPNNLNSLTEKLYSTSVLNSSIPGLIAYLLSIIYQFNNHSITSYKSNELRNKILNKAGANLITTSLKNLNKSEKFKDCIPWFQLCDILQFQQNLVFSELYFDYLFVEFFSSTHLLAQDALLEQNNSSQMMGDNLETKNLKLELIEEKEKTNELQKKLKEYSFKEKDYIREIDNLKDALDKAVVELAQLKRDIRYNNKHKQTSQNKVPENNNDSHVIERKESKKAVEIDDTEVFSI